MFRSIDGATIAAEIRLQRQIKKKKSFLILEGIDDIKVLRNFAHRDDCEIVNGYRKQNVIDAVHLLEDDGYLGVSGIVDSDFDQILGISHESDNIINIKCHDLDVLIFMSGALDKYLGMVCDDNIILAFQNRVGISIRDSVLNTASVLGSARLASVTKDLNVFFKNLELHEFVDSTTLAIRDSIFSHLIDRSSNPKCNARQLRTFSEEILRSGHEKMVLCQGHDVARVLGIALRKAIGNRKVNQTWGSEVEKGLRLAFDWELFQATPLFKTIKQWEDLNRPWRLLR